MVGAVAVVCVWTLANGTSLAGVYDAMFPFRLQAGRLLASPANHGSRVRLISLLFSWLICGGALVMAATAWALWRRRLGGTVVWALVVTVGFEVTSALAGGSYWSHYLIQVVAPLAVLVGVAAARGATSARVVLVASAVVCAVAWTVAFPWQTSSLPVERRLGGRGRVRPGRHHRHGLRPLRRRLRVGPVLAVPLSVEPADQDA